MLNSLDSIRQFSKHLYECPIIIIQCDYGNQNINTIRWCYLTMMYDNNYKDLQLTNVKHKNVQTEQSVIKTMSKN